MADWHLPGIAHIGSVEHRRQVAVGEYDAASVRVNVGKQLDLMTTTRDLVEVGLSQ
ncbi:MAG: hypothetical protein JO170_30735 [Verrucomicrobia bacterium]|nr:hypothetical protein [Verrucomicrobiota bacterium]